MISTITCHNLRMYVCMYVRMYVCMYVCMYVRTYVCTYMVLSFELTVAVLQQAVKLQTHGAKKFIDIFKKSYIKGRNFLRREKGPLCLPENCFAPELEFAPSISNPPGFIFVENTLGNI